MKRHISLRLLCVLSFMLLISPFYDSCSGRGLKETAVDVPTESVTENEITNVPKVEVAEPITENQEPFLDKIYDRIDDDSTQNAFEFAWISFDLFDMSFQDFKKSTSNGIKNNDFTGFFYCVKNFSFLFIVILTFLNLILSFTSKIKKVFQFSKTILILLAISVICIFLEGLFENINQIKWGYYSFMVVNMMIFYVSKKILKPTMP